MYGAIIFVRLVAICLSVAATLVLQPAKATAADFDESTNDSAHASHFSFTELPSSLTGRLENRIDPTFGMTTDFDYFDIAIGALTQNACPGRRFRPLILTFEPGDAYFYRVGARVTDRASMQPPNFAYPGSTATLLRHEPGVDGPNIFKWDVQDAVEDFEAAFPDLPLEAIEFEIVGGADPNINDPFYDPLEYRIALSPAECAGVSTWIFLRSDINPSSVGQTVTFTATVVGEGNVTGEVTFKSDGVVLGVVQLSEPEAKASLSTASLSAGRHTITAEYSGAPGFDPSVRTLAQTVRAATVTSLSSSTNPSFAGEDVTFTASVSATTDDHSNGMSGSQPITGTVTFRDGDEIIGTVPLGDGGGELQFRSIAAGRFHTCGLTAQEKVKCWGYNRFGQLGDGTTDERWESVAVIGLNENIRVLSSMFYHTCAVAASGGVKCWGNNSDGQLGDGSDIHRSNPVAVDGLSNGIRDVAVGHASSCALTTAGIVKCWGDNDRGQLGNGSRNDSRTPVIVAGLPSGVQAIASGGFHVCAVTRERGILCWGANDNGQLGDGTKIDRTNPVQVTGLTSGVARLTAGFLHTCTLLGETGIKCWGNNQFGQLGNGSDGEPVLTPVDTVGLGVRIRALAAGSVHTCALSDVGGAWCWGHNSSGQLGSISSNLDLPQFSAMPTPVTNLPMSVSSVVGGGDHTCAVTVNDRIVCWGNNRNGQLGDGTTVSRRTPDYVPAPDSDTAAWSTSNLSIGSHSIRATYNGNEAWGESSSSDVEQVVFPTPR